MNKEVQIEKQKNENINEKKNISSKIRMKTNPIIWFLSSMQVKAMALHITKKKNLKKKNAAFRSMPVPSLNM